MFTGHIDKTTWSFKGIDYEHHEIHEGSHFMIKDFINLTTGTSIEFLFVTQDSTKWPHFLFAADNEAEAEYVFIEGVTAVVSGTTLLPVNSNRNYSATTSVLNCFTSPLDVGFGSGTTISRFRRGSGRKLGGEVRSADEVVLKQNTKYYIRISERAGSDNLINYFFAWYEHTNH